MSNRPREGICIELQVTETLHLDIPAGVVDSGRISITLESKSGQRARLRIKADDEVTIQRRPAAKRTALA